MIHYICNIPCLSNATQCNVATVLSRKPCRLSARGGVWFCLCALHKLV